MSKNTWVLGASDPEMERIEQLLRDAGERVEYAVAPGRDGAMARVHPGNAYAATGPAVDGPVILVECDLSGGIHQVVGLVDHHRPGDPGYGAPPEEAVRRSSIGQVIRRLADQGAVSLLAWECAPWPAAYEVAEGYMWIDAPADRWCVSVRGAGRLAHPRLIPQDLVLTAAADHCLAAAYAGNVPGVDPPALMVWRAESRAAFQRRPVEAVLADVRAALALVRAAPRLDLGGCQVADMRPGMGAPDAGGWGDVPELPEAATRSGIAYIATPKPGPDGRVKVVLGAAPAPAVEAWLRGEGAAAGLVGLYGDPARGFAGGYVRGEGAQ
jgi:hypothetical protein